MLAVSAGVAFPFVGCSEDPENVPLAPVPDARTDTGHDANPIDSGGDVLDASVDGSDGAVPLPDSLADTGLYSNFAQKTLADGVRPYTPGLTFWSDGAQKSRFLYLPPGTKIDTSNMDEWVFPIGTKVWKEFVVDSKRVETRLFWKVSATEWLATTY